MTTFERPCFKISLIPLIKKQLNTAKKAQLKTALEKLNGTSATGSKIQLIDQISKELFQKINTFKDQFDPVSKAKQFIKDWFKTQIGQIINQQRTDQMQELFKSQFKGIDLSKPLRNLRNNQILVVNTWTDEKLDEYNCICPKAPNSLFQVKSTQNCYKCGVRFHMDCLWGRSRQIKNLDSLPQCPSCFLINCLPHKKVQKVLFAGYLPTSKSNKLQFLMNFKVSQEMKQDKKISFQARCMRIKSQSEYNRYEMTWPDNSTIMLNSQKMGQFKSLPTNTPLKRRSDQQLILNKLSTYCAEYQSLVIEQRHQYDNMTNKYDYASHFIMIFAVSVQTQQEIMKKFKNSRLTISQSKQILKNYLGSNNSNDVQIQKLSVSLKCPMFFTKIQTPVRSKHCSTHFQPFDLKNFITISKTVGKGSAQRYKCPTCRKRAYDLVVDQYLLQLMNSKNNGENISQITFKADGQPHFQEDNEVSDIQSEDQKPKLPVTQNKISQQKIKCSLFSKVQQDEQQRYQILKIHPDGQNIVLIDLQDDQIPFQTNNSIPLIYSKLEAIDYNKILNQKKPQVIPALSLKRSRQVSNQEFINQKGQTIRKDDQKQIQHIRKIVKKNFSYQKQKQFFQNLTKGYKNSTNQIAQMLRRQQTTKSNKKVQNSKDQKSNKNARNSHIFSNNKDGQNLQKNTLKVNESSSIHKISSQVQPQKPSTFLQKPSKTINQKGQSKQAYNSPANMQHSRNLLAELIMKNTKKNQQQQKNSRQKLLQKERQRQDLKQIQIKQVQTNIYNQVNHNAVYVRKTIEDGKHLEVNTNIFLQTRLNEERPQRSRREQDNSLNIQTRLIEAAHSSINTQQFKDKVLNGKSKSSSKELINENNLSDQVQSTNNQQKKTSSVKQPKQSKQLSKQAKSVHKIPKLKNNRLSTINQEESKQKEQNENDAIYISSGEQVNQQQSASQYNNKPKNNARSPNKGKKSFKKTPLNHIQYTLTKPVGNANILEKKVIDSLRNKDKNLNSGKVSQQNNTYQKRIRRKNKPLEQNLNRRKRTTKKVQQSSIYQQSSSSNEYEQQITISENQYSYVQEEESQKIQQQNLQPVQEQQYEFQLQDDEIQKQLIQPNQSKNQKTIKKITIPINNQKNHFTQNKINKKSLNQLDHSDTFYYEDSEMILQEIADLSQNQTQHLNHQQNLPVSNISKRNKNNSKQIKQDNLIKIDSHFHNNFDNPIQLQDSPQENPNFIDQDHQNHQQNGNFIEQQLPVISKQKRYQVECQKLRDEIQKKRKNLTQKVLKHYKIQPIKEDDQKLFWQILQEVNMANQFQIFT